MKRLSDRFAESAAACLDLRQLRALLDEAARELGFDHYALVDHASLDRQSEAFLRLDNYPREWVEELLRGGHAFDDPVHLASRRSNMGFGWTDLHTLVELGPSHERILARSRHHGIGNGFTVPANVPSEPSASCSFAVRVGRELPGGRLHCAELVGAHAIRAARRLRPFRRQRPRLSRREVECLRLIAMGKTDWEIARILGIGSETARQYVKRARAAYDTVSRSQLVVYGLRDDWIRVEDLAPFRPRPKRCASR